MTSRMKFLRPGLHRMWTIDPNVAIRVYDVTGPAPELTDELRAVIPAAEVVEAQVRQFEKGLKYVQGSSRASSSRAVTPSGTTRARASPCRCSTPASSS